MTFFLSALKLAAFALLFGSTCVFGTVFAAADAAQGRIQGRALTTQFPSRPAFVRAVYLSFRDVDWNDPGTTAIAACDAGFNVILLSFFSSGTATDVLASWAAVPASRRSATVATLHSKGCVLLLSAGGSTDLPYATPAISKGAEFGQRIAQFALDFHFDGVDLDLEGLGPFCTAPSLTGPQVVLFVVSAVLKVREMLGPSRLVVSAPQAPYFSPLSPSSASLWAGDTGCFTGIYAASFYNRTALDLEESRGAVSFNVTAAAKAVLRSFRTAASPSEPSAAIDFFFVQYYNQGGCYESFASLFEQSSHQGGGGGSCPFPGTSILEISRDSHIPPASVVVGKPLLPQDSTNGGWISAAPFGRMLGNASIGPGGVFVLQWSASQAPSWLRTVAEQADAASSAVGGLLGLSPTVSPFATSSPSPSPSASASATPSLTSSPSFSLTSSSAVSLSPFLMPPTGFESEYNSSGPVVSTSDTAFVISVSCVGAFAFVALCAGGFVLARRYSLRLETSKMMAAQQRRSKDKAERERRQRRASTGHEDEYRPRRPAISLTAAATASSPEVRSPVPLLAASNSLLSSNPSPLVRSPPPLLNPLSPTGFRLKAAAPPLALAAPPAGAVTTTAANRAPPVQERRRRSRGNDEASRETSTVAIPVLSSPSAPSPPSRSRSPSRLLAVSPPAPSRVQET